MAVVAALNVFHPYVHVFSCKRITDLNPLPKPLRPEGWWRKSHQMFVFPSAIQC